MNNFEKTELIAQTHSPYLARLIEKNPDLMSGLRDLGIEAAYEQFCKSLDEISGNETDKTSLMRELRIAKGKLALLTALADIDGIWSLKQVTAALSDFAEKSLMLVVNHLLASAVKQEEILSSNNHGIIILGLGKLGGKELNYSSDIDLIIFYDPEKLDYKGKRNTQQFMNRFAHDLVSIMQDRTSDGYVFRTDLRLRPDPASTPPAVTITSAYYYYEGVGQNWERAAMIKARVVAGDIEAGEKFIKSLAPFMWRKSLDFAAINDIHSIKRQMDTRQNKEIKPLGHNIKLGLGGIREIEFYTQIHQLIWGGREQNLRLRATCDVLVVLKNMGLVDERKEKILQDAYVFLRTLEHRIQMVADEQTHSLPATSDGFKNIAEFMGYENTDLFSQDLLKHLYAVHEIYSSSFRSAEGLGDTGNLVFTGVSHDADTLKTISAMGYKNPEVVSEIIMGWHHGSCRATRTKRARELLTEMMPAILKRLAETASPDTAFLRFNEFLKNLPAAIQLFSLFQMNSQLLGLIADIMGSAPTLATSLSHNPELLDAVLYEDFYSKLPDKNQLLAQAQTQLQSAEHFEDYMDNLLKFRNEKQFQAGVQFLKHMVTAEQSGEFLSDLAEVVVEKTLAVVTADFEKTYGKINGSRFAIIALGKLGSRDMTFASDLDLVFVYDTPDFDDYSDGEKSFTAGVYYNRLAQRLINTLSAMGRHGRLYEVDTRLRPSGKQGLLAVSKKALSHYFSELAWTFEYMALTKARAVAGDNDFANELNEFIKAQIVKDRDIEKLRADVVDMRERIAKEYGSDDIWDIKYARGGLIDIDFICQYFVLAHMEMDIKISDELKKAEKFLNQIFNMLRLCADGKFDSANAPDGLKKLLTETVKTENFEQLQEWLISVEKIVREYFDMLLVRD